MSVVFLRLEDCISAAGRVEDSTALFFVCSCVELDGHLTLALPSASARPTAVSVVPR